MVWMSLSPCAIISMRDSTGQESDRQTWSSPEAIVSTRFASDPSIRQLTVPLYTMPAAKSIDPPTGTVWVVVDNSREMLSSTQSRTPVLGVGSGTALRAMPTSWPATNAPTANAPRPMLYTQNPTNASTSTSTTPTTIRRLR